MPASAGTTSDGLIYSIESDRITITGCAWSLGVDVYVPLFIEGLPVRAIGTSAFIYQTYVTSITLPDSIESIGASAFQGCSKLANISLGNGLRSLGDHAFSDCSKLTTLELPSGVNAIGASAFAGCTILSSVNIPSGVTNIGERTFSGCNALTSLTLPSGVTSIGQSAFSGCTLLASVNLPDHVASIGDSAFLRCSSLSCVSVPEGVTSIGGNTFSGCTNLKSASLPTSVTSIGFSAFHGCISLESVNISEGVTSIGNNAFSNSGLKSVTIPGSIAGGMTYVSSIFEGCTGLTSAVLSPGITFIGEDLFRDCTSLATVSIPATVTDILSNAFSGCTSLKSANLPSGLTNICSNAFYQTGLMSISIPASVKTIWGNAFNGCANLTSLTLSNGIASIRDNAFAGCTKLTGVTIPASLTTTGVGIFSGCSGMTGVTFSPGLTSIGTNMFENCEKLASVTFPSSVTNIGNKAFFGCGSLTSVSVPGTVKSIGGWVFENCTNLASVTLFYGIEIIGEGMFNGCPKLTTITLPESLTTFGGLRGNIYITSLALPSSITSIGDYAFSYCTALQNITIPSSVTSIGEYAFQYCTALQAITVPGSVTTIGKRAFYNCDSLASINLSVGLASIGNTAFSGCGNLTSIYIPKGVTYVGNSMFYECYKLTKAYLPKSINYLWDPFETTAAWIYVYEGSYAESYCASYGRLKVMNVQLSQASISIKEGATGQLWSTVLHYNTNMQVSWAIDHPEVATVDQTGKITGIIPGSATVTATVIGDEDLTATCMVEIKPDLPKVTLNAASGALYPNETLTLNATVLTEDGIDPGVTWKSSDETIATVEDGTICALKAGTATITATAADGSGRSASCFITVKQYVTGVTLDQTNATLYTGDTLTLIPMVSPSDASDKGISWTSGDSAITTVGDSGVVTALKAGVTTVTVSTKDGSNKSAICTITVKQYATGVGLCETSATLYTGDTLTLTPTVSPRDTSDKDVTWTSSDDTVATIADGVVTAIKAGSATITATAADGSGVSGSCQLTVLQLAAGVLLNQTSASLYGGETLTLQATVSPGDTSDKRVTWASSDEDVATVKDGVVTSLKAGNATITAMTADGSGKSAVCEITIWIPASGVTIGPVTGALLKPGDTLTLSADVQPEDAHDRSVIWSTNNPNAARVDGGVITAISRGAATITVTTHNGKTATCAVTVEDRVVGLALRVPDSTPATDGVYEVRVGETLQIGTFVKPEGIGHTLSFKSDSKAASVNSTGEIRGLINGFAEITVTARDTAGWASQTQKLRIRVITPVNSVTLPTKTQLLPGATKRLTAIISPADATSKALEWTSGDESIATVAGDGTVTAVAQGTAKITATATNGQSASCLVRVTAPATGVTITTESGEPYVNYKARLQLNAEVDPSTAYGEVAWKSNNTKYVTVDSNGCVYGRRVGRATVYATAADGSGIRGFITIQVITPVQDVRLPETDRVFVGRTKKLAAVLSPSSPTFKTLTWASDNEAVATVSQDGTVTAHALGTAAITASAYNGFSDSCTLTVAQPVEEIDLTPQSGFTVIYKGETVQLDAEASPDNANDRSLTWKSSNTRYATVDQLGFVTGRSAGKVRITAAAKDGSGVSKSIILVVTTPEKYIRLNRTSAVLYHNGETDALKTLKLTAAASKGTMYRGLTWSVQSGDAAMVDENGVVTALAEGEAVIRATTEKGHTADCVVTVRTLPASFELTTKAKTLAFKQSFNLGAEASFDTDCTEPALAWSTDNKKVATVSSTGIVKAGKKKTGTATITATTKNGIKASCVVTVVKALPKGTSDSTTAKAAQPHIALRLTGGDYTSSDNHVADVDRNGKVGLNADGELTLMAGGGQIFVKVEGGNPTELTLNEGAWLTLLSDIPVQWSTEDGSAVSVDGDGCLTALREGTASVVCKAEGWKWEIRIVVEHTGIVQLPDTSIQVSEPEPSVSEVPPVPEPSTEPSPSEEPVPPIEPSPSGEPATSLEPESEPTEEPAPSPEPEETSDLIPESDAEASSKLDAEYVQTSANG